MAKKLHKATEELAQAASKYKLSDEEREYNVIRNKIANEFGLHSTKKLTIEQLKAIQSIINNEPKRKVTDLGQYEYIHCKTKEEAERICDLMEKAGIEGLNASQWEYLKEDTVFCPFNGKWGDLRYVKPEGYVVYPASDFFPFTESKGKKTIEEAVKNNWGIHCATKKEADRICLLMDAAGLKWHNGESYVLIDKWHSAKEETCYIPSEGYFDDKEYVEANGIKVYPSTDFSPFTESKPKKKVTDLGKNEVIHCTTSEEAKRICKLMNEAGLHWHSGDSYLNTSCWELYREETYYRPKIGSHMGIDRVLEKGYTVHPSTDF